MYAMRLLLPVVLAVLAGCATVVKIQLDDRFGRPDPTTFDRPRPAAAAPDYWTEVRPILDQRCVSCHACYGAPCQLNLASNAGITRGANPAQVYANRLLADPPTRLGFDAGSNAEWRQKGFFSVLNERAQIPEANRDGGVMYRLLALKQAYPGPDSGRLASRDIDLSLEREQICTTPEAVDHYAGKHPERGMPFALPALTPDEHRTLAGWLESGAPYTPAPALPHAALARVADWESFLNGESLKEQLSARYIYEHWYAGHLHFPEAPGRYFELVRSRTPPGQPIDAVATRRPFDDPGVPRVWYRLRLLETTPVAKTFMPLALDAARMERLRSWFLKPAYRVAALPGYDPEQASNPFATFRDLPVDSRYRFMLDDAQFIMTGFMKGPVCRGQVALKVIQDQFWVVFRSPNSAESKLVARMLDADAPNLRLPAAQQSNVGLLAWRDYAKLEARHLKNKSQALSLVDDRHLPKVGDLWNGDGHNPTAGLTVLRHFDSASVLRGLVSERPQTAMVFGYPLFERMHYLLLAGFDIYGNLGHQLTTRLYMDFLRMEGELDFLALLPVKDRQAVLDHWYRGRNEPQTRYLADANAYFPRETGMRYRGSDTLGELYAAVRGRVAPVGPPALDWKGDLAPSAAEIAQLQRLSAVRGLPAAQMPELSLLLLRRPDGTVRVASLVRNSAHSNVAQIFDEDARRLPDEDTLQAVAGVAGAYPNALFAVAPEQLVDFVDAVTGLADPAGLTALTDRFGVRRTDRRFWPLSDALHAEWRRWAAGEAAVLDYSRLENN
jgi:hypothetical protein